MKLTYYSGPISNNIKITMVEATNQSGKLALKSADDKVLKVDIDIATR